MDPTGALAASNRGGKEESTRKIPGLEGWKGKGSGGIQTGYSSLSPGFLFSVIFLLFNNVWPRAGYLTLIKFINKIRQWHFFCLPHGILIGWDLKVFIRMLCKICKGWCSHNGLLLLNIFVIHVTFHEVPSLNFGQAWLSQLNIGSYGKNRDFQQSWKPRSAFIHMKMWIVGKPCCCLWAGQMLSPLVLAVCRSCLLFWLPHQPHFK